MSYQIVLRYALLYFLELNQGFKEKWRQVENTW